MRGSSFCPLFRLPWERFPPPMGPVREAAGMCAPGWVYGAFPGSRGPCLHTGETPFLRGSIKTQKAPLTGELQILLERISQAAACCRSFFQNTLSSMKPMPSSR